MNIYEILRVLIWNVQPIVESEEAVKLIEQFRANALDLIDQLEKIHAFGTLASITQGETHVKRTYVR